MRKRKAKGKNLVQAKKTTNHDILTKYEEQRKEDDNFNGEVHERVEEENDRSHEEVDESDDNERENEGENGKRIVNVVIEHAGSHDQNETSVGNEDDRETSDEDLFDTQVPLNPINLEGAATDQVPPRIHNNIKLKNVTDHSDEELRNNEVNLSMKELIEQNRKLNAIIEKQRSDSHNQHLQREREQQQIFEEEERQRRLIELHQRRKLLERAQRERERRERERGNQIDDEEDDLTDQVHIGGQIFISSLAYTEAFREYRPSKFITIMSHAIWGYKNLALRAVKVGKRNAKKLPLTPAKKLVLEKQYKKFLKQRNLSADMETVERNKINTYLGRSITSAIKKVANSE